MMRTISNINRSGKLPPPPSAIPTGVEVAFEPPDAYGPDLVYLICAGDDHSEFIQPSEYFEKGGSNAVYAIQVSSAPSSSSLPVYRARVIMRVLGMSKMVTYDGTRQHTCVVEPYARPGQEGANYFTNGRATLNIFSDSAMIDADNMLIIPSYDLFAPHLKFGTTVPIEWQLPEPESGPRYCVFDSFSASTPKTMIPLLPMGPGGSSLDTGLVMTNKGGRLTVGPFSQVTTAPDFTFRAVADALSLAAQGADAAGAVGKLYWFCIYKEKNRRIAEAHIMLQGDPDSHAARLEAPIVATCWTHLYYDPLPYSAP